ncbi:MULTISPECIES: type VI secretion system membrane subunit TssM [unclassified Psychrobacter]|uniref:type VI secretion system membrane subunit TssM n=1 Tax=unclassified Psychrobacter TaxID=196806 RepID=UPI0025B58902|nr:MULTISPECIES: type VI secretion system membrane subunit TssM [unclassified Psychrobacter]MDN3453964.1 type VI secretion system membrane subunit TssM [Psychrobacter sp. APC 3350]MDN3503166.1 type VI secretion system membrane subunit TssM [Psychrobacter sp. 5A.1]
MFSRFFHLIYNPRVLFTLGIIVALVLLYDYVAIKTFLIIIGMLITCTVLGVLAYYLWKKRKKASDDLANLVEDNGNDESRSEDSLHMAKDENAQEVQALRQQMQDAIKTIRKSKIGDQTGKAALYELPWYMVIGNPAAGKSSAVLHSGLKFPFMEQGNKLSVKGVGGTRNCDWFFSTEGILLDTAGRYSVYEEDRSEWLSFLSLLKKNRPKAPINGIIIAVSIAELTKNDPSYALDLAKNLRSRVQDLTEQLEVYAPVYVVFTKMDLISGFRDFFNDYEQEERSQVWGATIPYPEDPENINITDVFEEHFGVLVNGLKDLSTTKLSLRHQRTVSPSLMTFPMEFQSLRPMIRTLMHALFEDNPFQFKPILRGFYFTSALQDGQVSSQMTLQMVQNYGLHLPAIPLNAQQEVADKPYFLQDLFSKVILKDKHLVKQHKNRHKRSHRALATLAAVVTLCAAVGLWTWSYANNKQLTERVIADLQQVAALQKNANGDLQSQLESLTILQSRIEQLEGYEEDKPLSLSFGLYQGDKLKQKLLAEYYNGISIIVLAPTKQNLETFLTEVNTNADQLEVRTETSTTDETSETATNDAYIQSDPTDVEDAYSALKAYLMLGNHDNLEASHLSDQMTRFWRNWLEANRADMPRDKMIRQAERILSFTLTHVDDSAFPLIQNDLGLIDKTRSNLSKVSKGQPARERVYSEIKMRSAARFPSVTVAQITQNTANEALLGSYVISGTFTKQAWDSFVSDEIDKAATTRVVADDWVLATSSQDDLTLTGSPEQIRQYLVNRYKQEYISEWKRFLSQVYVRDSEGFDDHAVLLNQLSNATESPLKTLFETVDRQTQWDNKSTDQAAADGGQSRRSFVNWFKQTILRQSPAELRQAEAALNNGSSPNTATPVTQVSSGVIAQEFSSIHTLVTPREENQDLSLLDNYLVSLGNIRTRFNNIARSADIGPDALLFASQTLSPEGSELTKSLQILDEQILSQANSEIKQLVRPLLSEPLTRSFNMLLTPTKAEINKVWKAQVRKPFLDNLEKKYPFTANANLEATPAEIGQFFGEDSYVARFVNETLSPFIIRRGDQISSKIWNGAGLGLNPQFVADFGRYFTNYTGSNSAGTVAGSGAANQTTFQIMPLPVSGLTEYTIVVDGQQLRYRMGTQAWTTFVWPNPSSQPGASIRAKDYDGRDFTVFEEAGSFGVERLINSARRTELGDDIFEMAWSGDGITISVRFRIISGSPTGRGRATNPFTGMKLPDEVIALGVTRTAVPVSDSSAANNSNPANNSPTNLAAPSNGQSNTPPTTPPNALNLTPNANTSDGDNAQTDASGATTATTTNATTTETQEQTP